MRSWDDAIGPAIKSLDNLYLHIDVDLHNQLTVSHVFIVQYPDPTHNDAGSTCNMILDDVTYSNVLGFLMSPISALAEQQVGVTANEADWARDHVVEPLNLAIRSAAIRLGWEYVDGIAAMFATHGYCCIH